MNVDREREIIGQVGRGGALLGGIVGAAGGFAGAGFGGALLGMVVGALVGWFVGFVGAAMGFLAVEFVQSDEFKFLIAIVVFVVLVAALWGVGK